jgi:hypothetical protein
VLGGVREGRRHIEIFRMVCSLRGQGTPQPVVRDLALHAARNCRPPFPPAEALAIVDDVFARYPTNAERSIGLSPERTDVLVVLSEALSPPRPADVARVLGKSRGAVKKLLHQMFNDGQVRRADGRYVPSLDASDKDRALFPVTGGERRDRPSAAPTSGRPGWLPGRDAPVDVRASRPPAGAERTGSGDDERASFGGGRRDGQA